MPTQMQNFCGVLWDSRRRVCLPFKRYIECFFFGVWFLYGLGSTTIWSFTFPSPFSTHFLLLHSIFGISMDPRHPFPVQCWIMHRVFRHSRPLGRESPLPSFCIPCQEIHDFCFSSLSSMTVWGVVRGTGGQFTNDSSFPFRTFLEHYPLFPGSGVSDRLSSVLLGIPSVKEYWPVYYLCLYFFPAICAFTLLFILLLYDEPTLLRVEDTGLSLRELYPVTIPHRPVGHWWPIQLCTINPEQSCLSSTYIYVYFLSYFLNGC